MTNQVRIEVDCATGIATEVPLTSEEIAEMEARAIAWEEQQLILNAEAVKKETDRQEGIATLKSLGLTDAQISALLG